MTRREAHAAREAKQAIKAARSGMNAATPYDEGYTLIDCNGRALANVRYRVRIGANIAAEGITDAQGRVSRITTDTAQRLIFEVSGHHEGA
ncbi:hypothetical protein PSAC2689_10690 [Paraburkholderia sacchari]|uniref:hypothetical protein n=1 Tax=Paraburkholderia sacchari TaxID=159450 RepID=UPI0039A4F517